MDFLTMRNLLFLRSLTLLLLVSGSYGFAQSQTTNKEELNQLDLFKVNLTQLGVNELRLLYETQLGETTSLEFGAGYIYPNRIWYSQGGSALIASGVGLYAGFRKYRIPKRYFSAPKFRSYFSPWVFYRRSTYKDEWFLFDGGLPELSECALYSEKINQLGAVIRLGWQTDHGRLAIDIFSGLGIKYTSAVVTQHALNVDTDVCMLTADSDQTEIVTKPSDLTVILNGGIRFGLRRNNRERKFKETERPSNPDYPDAPPSY